MSIERAFEIFDNNTLPSFPCNVSLDEWYEAKSVIKDALQKYLDQQSNND